MQAALKNGRIEITDELIGDNAQAQINAIQEWAASNNATCETQTVYNRPVIVNDKTNEQADGEVDRTKPAGRRYIVTTDNLDAHKAFESLFTAKQPAKRTSAGPIKKDKEKTEATALFAEGKLNNKQIAEKVGVSVNSIGTWKRAWEASKATAQ
ncbi:hypothetical protein BG58_10915 [Caballeronia jiangsuensis]|nr:hypothetical protein BG58_10915 [Caballeronia jiangsuensis]